MPRQGDRGFPGQDGVPGRPGIPGRKGDRGLSVKGEPGEPGRSGQIGLKGEPGSYGQKGEPGEYPNYPITRYILLSEIRSIIITLLVLFFFSCNIKIGQCPPLDLINSKGDRGAPGEKGEPGPPGRDGLSGDKGLQGFAVSYKRSIPGSSSFLFQECVGNIRTSRYYGVSRVRLVPRDKSVHLDR